MTSSCGADAGAGDSDTTAGSSIGSSTLIGSSWTISRGVSELSATASRDSTTSTLAAGTSSIGSWGFSTSNVRFAADSSGALSDSITASMGATDSMSWVSIPFSMAPFSITSVSAWISLTAISSTCSSTNAGSKVWISDWIGAASLMLNVFSAINPSNPDSSEFRNSVAEIFG